MKKLLRDWIDEWRLTHRMGNVVIRRFNFTILGWSVLGACCYLLWQVAQFSLWSPEVMRYQGPDIVIKERADIIDRYGHLLAMDVPQEDDGVTRFYPKQSLTSHLVGYTGKDHEGLGGIENAKNDRLWRDKGDLRLTIDIAMQHILHDELMQTMKQWQAKGAVGLLLDAQNSHIRALVSLPDFDPHKVGSASDDKLFNRARWGLYEMGSLFKLFTALLVLENGGDDTTFFDVVTSLSLKNYVIKGEGPQSRFARGGGYQNMRTILAHSLNVGAARAALQVGGRSQRQLFERLYMLDKLSTELDGAKSSTSKKWSDLNVATIAYGYGLSVTPLHLAAAVTAMVNGGMYRYPTLLEEESSPKSAFRVISEKDSSSIRQMMRYAVTHGTGKQADIDVWKVGGKTGTARKISEGVYDKNRLLTSFVAAFPIEAPRFVLMVLIDEPQQENQSMSVSGGNVAAPVSARIIRRIHAHSHTLGERERERHHEDKVTF